MSIYLNVVAVEAITLQNKKQKLLHDETKSKRKPVCISLTDVLYKNSCTKCFYYNDLLRIQILGHKNHIFVRAVLNIKNSDNIGLHRRFCCCCQRVQRILVSGSPNAFLLEKDRT